MKGTSRAALGLSILGVVIPKYGIVVTGVSALFVIFSGMRRSSFAKAAVLINFCNIFFLSPLFLLSLYYMDMFEQPLPNGRVVYAVVLCLQLITLIMRHRQERRRRNIDVRKRARAATSMHYSKT